MKSIITATMVAFLSLSAEAATLTIQNNTTSETAVTAADPSSLSSLLNIYYDIKNALVNGDATTASAKAGDFQKAVNGVDMKALSGKEMDVFMAAQKKLATDAGQIAETNDLKKQRDAFASFSTDMFTLANGVKLSSAPVSQATCPMKKATWLSNEATIKNPYFGKQMLSCGKVTNTIQ